jgi:hypothetical protein
MSALAKINARVKQLAKKHPGTKRVTLQRQAGREYREGKLGRVSGAKKRVSGKVLGKSKRRKSTRRKTTVTSVRVKSVGKVGSVASHMSMAKKLLKEQIGWAEASRFTAVKAKSKRELAKRIAKLKTEYRKLS